MKPRDAALRLKRFEVSEKARTVVSMESMIGDFERMANDLARQIAAEEERTGIRDTSHFAYSTFAKAASLRRRNLLNSVADLRAKGMNVTENLDKAKFQAVLAPVYADFAKRFGQANIDRIKNYR